MRDLQNIRRFYRSEGKKRGFCRSQAVSIHKNTFDVCAWRWFFLQDHRFSSEEKAQKAYEEYRFLDSGVLYYPARDLLFYHADIKGNYLMKQRMEVIRSMVTRQKNQEITVITTMDAFLDGLSPAEEIVSKRIQISSGDTVDFTKLQERLSCLGYAREVQIEGPGQFAVRGGILDIFRLQKRFRCVWSSGAMR